jgi:hypothetical protein
MLIYKPKVAKSQKAVLIIAVALSDTPVSAAQAAKLADLFLQ